MTHSRRGLFGLLAGAAASPLLADYGARGLTAHPTEAPHWRWGAWGTSPGYTIHVGRNDLSPSASDDLNERLAAWAGAVA